MAKEKILKLNELSFLNSKKVGVLGGSFNPTHHGHIEISLYALRYLKLDYILWVVAKQNPLKDDYQANMQMRSEFALEITRMYPNIIISTIEDEIENSENTINVLKAIKTTVPDVKMTWLMGYDCLESFHLWPGYNQFTEYADIAIFNRKCSLTDYKETISYNKFLKYQLDHVIFCNNQIIDISSSEIRRKSNNPFAFKSTS